MANFEPGTVVDGRYRIEAVLGRGGLSTVYRALDQRLKRYVALKVLPPPLANDPEFVGRLRQEALNAARLDHPNILRTFDFASSRDGTYLAIEYVDGGSLESRLVASPGALDPKSALAIAEQIGAALSYAHSRGVIHRDIKPSNVMLSTDGRVLLADFGLAKSFSSVAQSSVTMVGTILGTPEYMSPEQAKGEPLDARSDIYSLGIVLYQLLTGRVPFHGDNVTSTFFAQVTQPPPPLRALNPSITATLEQVILRALAKDPVQRYPTVDDFIRDLRAAIEAQVLPDTPVADARPSGRVLRPTPSPAKVAKPSAARHGWPHWLWIVLLVVIGGNVGLLIVLSTRSSGSGVSLPVALMVLLAAGIVVLSAIAVWLIWTRSQRVHHSAPSAAAPMPQEYTAHPPPVASAPGADRTMITSETLPFRPDRTGMTAVLQRPPDVFAFLLVLNGPQRGRQLTIKDTVAGIGRDAQSNQIIIDDHAVSRQHARIRLEGNRFLIYDLASSNGTLVNGMNVTRHELRDRDEIRVGDTNLIFMQVASGISPDARRRLQEFDAVWDDLTRAVRRD